MFQKPLQTSPAAGQALETHAPDMVALGEYFYLCGLRLPGGPATGGWFLADGRRQRLCAGRNYGRRLRSCAVRTGAGIPPGPGWDWRRDECLRNTAADGIADRVARWHASRGGGGPGLAGLRRRGGRSDPPAANRRR